MRCFLVIGHWVDSDVTSFMAWCEGCVQLVYIHAGDGWHARDLFDHIACCGVPNSHGAVWASWNNLLAWPVEVQRCDTLRMSRELFYKPNRWSRAHKSNLLICSRHSDHRTRSIPCDRWNRTQKRLKSLILRTVCVDIPKPQIKVITACSHDIPCWWKNATIQPLVCISFQLAYNLSWRLAVRFVHIVATHAHHTRVRQGLWIDFVRLGSDHRIRAFMQAGIVFKVLDLRFFLNRMIRFSLV